MRFEMPDGMPNVKYIAIDGTVVIGKGNNDHHRVLVARMFGRNEGMDFKAAKELVSRMARDEKEVDMGRIRLTGLPGEYEVLDSSVQLGFPTADKDSPEFRRLKGETAKILGSMFPEDRFVVADS